MTKRRATIRKNLPDRAATDSGVMEKVSLGDDIAHGEARVVAERGFSA